MLEEGSIGIRDWLNRTREEPPDKLVAELGEVDLVDWLGRWYRSLMMMVAEQEARVATRGYFRFCDELVNVRRQIETSNAANSRLLLERLIVLWRKLPEG